MKYPFVRIGITMMVLVLSFVVSGALTQSFADEKRSFHPEIQAGPDYDFRKTTWGMSIDEVKASEEKKPDDEGILDDDEMAFNYLVYFDILFLKVKGQLVYLFYDGELVKIDIHFFDMPGIGENLEKINIEVLGEPLYREVNENIIFTDWRMGVTKMVLTSYLVRSKQVKKAADATVTFYYSPEN